MIKRIGEMLVEKDIISEEQLAVALLKSKSSNQKVGEALIELGYLTENQLYKVLSEQYNVEFITLDSNFVMKEFLSTVDSDFVYETGIIPFAKDKYTLKVAYFDVISDEDEKMLKQKFDVMEVKLYLVTKSNLCRFLKDYFKRDTFLNVKDYFIDFVVGKVTNKNNCGNLYLVECKDPQMLINELKNKARVKVITEILNDEDICKIVWARLRGEVVVIPVLAKLAEEFKIGKMLEKMCRGIGIDSHIFVTECIKQGE